jgi:quinolinate synthase
VGLGSNLGDRVTMLRAARAGLATLPGTTLTAESRIYVTAPVGGPEQGEFLNQVVEILTALTPRELLEAARAIETELGRERRERWGPRSIDLDILWYHGLPVGDEDLQLPHPRMQERRFVLEPLSELAPDLVLASGKTVQQGLAGVQDQQVRLLTTPEQGAAPVRSGSEAVDVSALQTEIRELARAKGAVILAHNYQRPEVQDVADVTGDSLGLSRQAAASQAKLIVFCGVHFMAETAAMLAPDRPVILPDLNAGCPMAEMVDVEGLEALKAKHPGAVVVSYINTTAAVKAISDICCTSANAANVLRSLPSGREIIFTPDMNLGRWAAKQAGREVVVWQGFCPTHVWIKLSHIEAARAAHPSAKVVVHPECDPEVSDAADAVESTSGMVRFCQQDDAKEYLIGTEVGMIHRLTKDCPGKTFYPVTEIALCRNMKLITLEKVLAALQSEGPVVTVDPEMRAKALTAVQRMVEVGG